MRSCHVNDIGFNVFVIGQIMKYSYITYLSINKAYQKRQKTLINAYEWLFNFGLLNKGERATVWEKKEW